MSTQLIACREGGDGHPVTYTPAEINSSFIKQLTAPIGWLGNANCSSQTHVQQASALSLLTGRPLIS